MYSQISKSLLKSYKENNVFLIKVISILSIFLLPIFLILAPLPAYLIYTNSVFSLPFLISVLFISLLTAISSNIYDRIHSRQYLYWAILITSYNEVRKKYCYGQMMFSILSLTLLIAGTFKLDSFTDSFPEIIIAVIAQYIYFRYRFNTLFSRSDYKFKASFEFGFLIKAFTNVFFHFSFFTILTIFNTMLMLKSNANNVTLSLSAIITLTCIILTFTMEKIVNSEFYKYEKFILSVSKKLYKKMIYILTITFFIMKAIPTLIFFGWMVSAID